MLQKPLLYCLYLHKNETSLTNHVFLLHLGENICIAKMLHNLIVNICWSHLTKLHLLVSGHVYNMSLSHVTYQLKIFKPTIQLLSETHAMNHANKQENVSYFSL